MRRSCRTAAFLSILTISVYGLTTYGGVRSPDEEVVFLTAESLAREGSFAVERGPTGWTEFGVAPGRDGRLYSVFGPLQSIVLVPAVWLGDTLAERIATVPNSLYSGDGFVRHMRGEPPSEPLRPHAIRFVASFLNVLVGALGVVLLWLLLRRVTGSEGASTLGALAYAFGSLAWSYSGTLFTEPLATALALGSLLAALGRGRAQVGASGLLLGLAVAAHVSAILFFPFFLAAAAWAMGRERAVRAAAFACGFGVVVALLGWHDWTRFGDVLETGRSVDPALAARLGYGEWAAPWRGLYGLTVGAGKGLLVYCPIVALGTLAWRSLHRRSPLLSGALGAAAAARLLFIAARTDWHGGFCVGPRLLLMMVPFLIVPLACWIAERPRRVRAAAAAVSIAVVEQAYLALSEPFRFLHWVRVTEMARGISVFADDRIYLDWDYSPLLHLLRGDSGSWVAPSVAAPLPVVVLAMAGFTAALIAIVALRRSPDAIGESGASSNVDAGRYS